MSIRVFQMADMKLAISESVAEDARRKSALENGALVRDCGWHEAGARGDLGGL